MAQHARGISDGAMPGIESWLTRLRLTGIVAPLVFVVTLPLVESLLLEPLFPGHGGLATGIFAALCVLAFGFAMFLLITRGYRRVLDLQERALAAERHSAVLVERDRIAREMHDGLAQVQSLLHLRLCAVQSTPELADRPQVRAELGELAEICRESVRDVRESILGLREGSRADQDFEEGLERYQRGFSRSSGIAVQLNRPSHPVVLSPAQEVQLSRVAQEALTNVRKHSGATAATIDLEQSPAGTTLTISDDGRGFSPQQASRHQEPGTGFGLHTMAERVAELGGTLQIDSAPGDGTRVRAHVPAAATVAAGSLAPAPCTPTPDPAATRRN